MRVAIQHPEMKFVDFDQVFALFKNYACYSMNLLCFMTIINNLLHEFLYKTNFFPSNHWGGGGKLTWEGKS